ncbi:MAG: mechanosensitive ion channel family protein [Bacteroidales bacterium]|nr:mechanosensitive ion channel family protein [Bacteroidales bacterium]MCF8454985.1 mechanosensitive ion channel family protein [Bacteroidales bacterium]
MEGLTLFSLTDWLESIGLEGNQIIWVRLFILLITLVLVAWITDWISKKVFLSIIQKIVRKSRTIWDDILLDKNVFSRLAHFTPAIVVYLLSSVVFSDFPDAVAKVVKSGASLYMVIMLMVLLNSFLNGVKGIYETTEVAENRPITGFVQLIKILIYLVGGIVILSTLLNKTPGYFLTGLGAFAAVLLLVFKDTILGFVASIQLSGNNMVKPGDWISMPKYNADGTVLEITLNTVKVQNWDKTIATIPTYAMVSESFSNWRGMEESGGRRIKRSLLIDMKSIRFCDEEMLDRFEKIRYIKSYIQEKRKIIKENNESLQEDGKVRANLRRLTNIGTFRIYIEKYLRANSNIHEEMTFLVRQLQPTELGLPLEIYVFSKDQRWAFYEAIQADIFDHLLAIIPEFDLRVFQNPSGHDFEAAFSGKD